LDFLLSRIFFTMATKAVATNVDSRRLSSAAMERKSVCMSPKMSSPKMGSSSPKMASPKKDDDVETRRMFDKRCLRIRNCDVFQQQISNWRVKNPLQENARTSSQAVWDSRVRVCVRKRPLFEHEADADEFDVLSVRDDELVVHNCLTKADLKSLYVSHMGFRFSRAFDTNADDDDVYAECAQPVVDHVMQGFMGTIFMFGQTGSGKTHTMGRLLDRAVDHIFNESTKANKPLRVTLEAFEIFGRGMRDLLNITGNAGELKVREDKNHKTQIVGLSALEVCSSRGLLMALEDAQKRRTTRATQANDTSSRSHAVYRIRLHSEGSKEGAAVLTLVDCAGSERNGDSTHHDAQCRKDAAEINSTIFALKECFRSMRSPNGQLPPYRESLLTMVLKDSFANDLALVVAIGTVSPSASDTEHSLGTLRSLQQLQGTQMIYEVKEDVKKPKVQEVQHPRNWSEEEVHQWLQAAIGGRARRHAGSLAKGTDGKILVRWPVVRFKQLCGGDDDLGTQLYQDLRQRIKAAGP